MRHPRTQEVSVSGVIGVGMDPREIVKRLSILGFISGAEGEGEGSGTPPPSGDGGQESSTTTTQGSEDKGSGQDPEPKTYDQAYVDNLRAENAKHRTRNKELEDAEEARKKAEMSDKERAEAELAEEKAKRETAETNLINERKRTAIIAAAGTAKFRDPMDALAFIDLADINMTEAGEPHKGSVDAAVEKVSKARAYLIGGSGSGDGGAQDRGKGQDANAEWVKQQEADIASRGGVKVGSSGF